MNTDIEQTTDRWNIYATSEIELEGMFTFVDDHDGGRENCHCLYPRGTLRRVQ